MVASEQPGSACFQEVTNAPRLLALSPSHEHADAKGPHPCTVCSTRSKHSTRVREPRVDLPGPPDNAAVTHRVGRETRCAPAGGALRLGSIGPAYSGGTIREDDEAGGDGGDV